MAMADIPLWLQPFLDRLAAEDRSAATRRGYRYDLLQFSAWYAALHGSLPELPRLIEHDLIAWRQHGPDPQGQHGVQRATAKLRRHAGGTPICGQSIG